MSNILFFIKTLVITFLLAAFMQAQVGKTTIEAHIISWISNSSITKPLQQVAEAGAKLIRNSWYEVKNLVESKIKTQEAPDQRRLEVKLRRSKEFLREQAQKAKEEFRRKNHHQVDRAWDETEKQKSHQLKQGP